MTVAIKYSYNSVYSTVHIVMVHLVDSHRLYTIISALTCVANIALIMNPQQPVDNIAAFFTG